MWNVYIQYDYIVNLKPDIPLILFTTMYVRVHVQCGPPPTFTNLKRCISDAVDEVQKALMLSFFEFQVSTMFTNFACKVWAEFSAWYWPWRISKLWCVLSRKKTFFYKFFTSTWTFSRTVTFYGFIVGKKDQNIQKICVIIPKIDM